MQTRLLSVPGLILFSGFSPCALAQRQFEELAIPSLAPGPGLSSCLALGDVDGDGDLDIVVGQLGEQNRLYLNDGTGIFTDATLGRMPVDTDNSQAVAFGDVDGDGDLDMVLGYGSYGASRQNRLYLNNGIGYFTDATETRMPVDSGETAAVALGDLDGDDDLDIVFGNGTVLGGGQQNRLYLNDGLGTFTDATAGQLPAAATVTEQVVLGDVDGDTDLDMVLGVDFFNVTHRLYLNDGTGIFTDASATQMPRKVFPRWAALGDVDGDADPDIVALEGRHSLRILLNDATGTFVDAGWMAPGPVGAHAVALGDIDEDDDLDIVLANHVQARLYLNNGAGAFTDVTGARIPVHSEVAEGVALGDLDGDVDLDIVVATWGLDPVYTNLHRQLCTPLVPTVSGPYDIQFHAQPGYATSSHTGFGLVGFGLSATPLPVPGLGTFFLEPTIVVPVAPVAIPQATGTGTHRLQIPPNPLVVGLVLYPQGLVVNNTTGESHFTGYTRDTIR